ncbi:MAG TPA: Mut7-C RNAse domain-containing protein [Gammaproteobacteria bacterium]
MSVGEDLHAAPIHAAEFRFYAELNDFLPQARRQRSFSYRYTGSPSLKDAIEALGVPHTEVDLILVDGRSAAFDDPVPAGARVAVYPAFETLDVAGLTRLRPEPLRVTRFVADVHLGTLARYLRLVGFDTVWRNDLGDDEIIAIAAREHRIILTRDRGILRDGRVTHGYWLRAVDPREQFEELVRALDLARRVRPYTRCLECNGLLEPLSREAAKPLVPARVHAAHREFVRCGRCGRVYWSGSHRARLDAIVRSALEAGPARS